jgi:hypothetical protein
MKRKLLTETPVCPRERFVIISYTTGLSFAKERIGPLAAIVTTVFYLLALCLFALSNTPENLFASFYSESLIKTTHQHFLLLVGFDTLIYQKYYDTPPILVGHHATQKVVGDHLPTCYHYTTLPLLAIATPPSLSSSIRLHAGVTLAGVDGVRALTVGLAGMAST